jgi:hypothetical protein
MLLKGYRQNVRFKDSDYQRFHTDATQQAGATIHNP